MAREGAERDPGSREDGDDKIRELLDAYASIDFDARPERIVGSFPQLNGRLGRGWSRSVARQRTSAKGSGGQKLESSH